MRWLRLALLGSLVAGFCGVLAIFALFWYYSQDLPDIRTVEDYHPAQINRIFAHDGSILGEFGEQRRSLVPVEEIPPLLLDALVSAEDAGFYQHDGVDFLGIARAMIANLLALRVRQGASTITQQVCKNLLLTHERSFVRKIKEAILAYRLENRLSKQEILYLYANEIYFGNGCYGVAEASHFYFNKPLKQLDIGQIAYVAGLPKGPGILALNRHPERAKTRQQYVLRRLKELAYISEADYARFIDAPLVFTPPEQMGEEAAYVVEEVRRRLSELLPEQDVTKSGLKIMTDIRPELQRAMAKELRENLFDYERRHAYRALPVLPKQQTDDWNEQIRQFSERFTRNGGQAEVLAFSAEHLPMTEKSVNDDMQENAQNETSSSFWRTMIRVVRAEKLYYAYITQIQDSPPRLTVQLGATRGFIEQPAASWTFYKKKKRQTKLSSIFQLNQAIVVALDGTHPPGEKNAEAIALKLMQVPEAQSAMLAIDVPSRAIVAMMGGFSAALSPFNRATQALRQPGSSFKPYVYLTALKTHRYTPASIVKDEAVTFPIPGSRPWSPQNFSGKFRGPIRLRVALANSVNVVAAKIINDIGPAAVIETARAFGIHSKLHPMLSLSLGASEVRLEEQVNAYATFANRGQYDDDYLIRQVISSSGRILYRRTPNLRQAIAPEEAAIMVSLMESVVKEGTSRRALALKRPVAGKTGTANDQRDAWFVGYSAKLAAGIWVGYDDHRPLGRGETGARAALPGWVAFMKTALQNEAVQPFPVAAGLLHAYIDPESGERVSGDAPGALEEVFLPGTLPPEKTSDSNPGMRVSP